MARTGEYRLQIYNLLYEKPVCDYTENFEKKKRENVLILGSGWTGNEAFKAVFWAGQAPDTELNITVASGNAAAYREQVLSEQPGACMPALKTYVEKKRYANLKFIDIDVEKELDAAGLAPLDFKENQYRYVIVSLGSAEHNWLAASELIPQLGAARSGEGAVLLNIFARGLAEDERELLGEHGRENGVQVHFFGNETGPVPELDRIARNLHFSYGMKYDQRKNKRESDAEFEAGRTAEFVEAPSDYAAGDVRVAGNFTGADYAADSSYASAVHIPVKLAVCREETPEKDPADTLGEAVQKKNRLYWRLTALEHRRWNAYVITRGFRAPTPREEETLLYRNGNTHQDKRRLLHLCLCDCGEKSSLAHDFDRQYALWLKKKCPADFPSELDRASLRAHQLAGKLAEQIRPEAVLERISGYHPEYSNLRHSVLKLLNDEAHSLELYQKSLETARRYAESVSKEEVRRLSEADEMLSAVRVRNARMDFFSLDEQLVEMLPFALWYGKKYGTVVTVSDGMSTATRDVVVPTLFCARNAVFIGAAAGSRKYQETVSAYFESRGKNTTPRFIPLSPMDMDTVCRCLEEQMEEYGAENLVICCGSGKGYAAPLAVGRLIEKYPGAVNLVQYDPKKGIAAVSGDKNIGAGLNNKSFSLSEYIRLMGGRVANEYAGLYDTREYETLTKLFKKYCAPTRYRKGSGKSQDSFSTWPLLIKFAAQTAKDTNYEEEILKEPEGEVLRYEGSFSENVFLGCLIGDTLNQLQTYHVIREYREEAVGQTVTVRFEYVNPGIGELFRTFEQDRVKEEDVCRSLKFIPMNGGLKIANRYLHQIPVLAPGETEVHRKVKLEFLQDLAEMGYITGLKTGDDQETVSYAFRDMETLRLLKKQGLVFELAVYYLMRESGQFDEVETGVKIAWGAEDVPLEQQILEELETDDSGGFGYNHYVQARGRAVRRSFIQDGKALLNEIDIIGLRGMSAVMVSCKTSDADNIQWIYEIRAVSEHFQTAGALAVSSDYTEKNRALFAARAEQMNVRLWGTETLWNPDRLRKELAKLAGNG